MLLESKGAVEVKAQIPPIRLGPEWHITSEWGKAQVNRWIIIPVFAGEVKNLRLVMLKYQGEALKEPEYNTICLLKSHKVRTLILRLSNNSSIIYI